MSKMPDALPHLSDAEFIRAYAEFSEDVYSAGWMAWQHRPAILFEEFPLWLASHPDREWENYERETLDAWRKEAAS